MSESGEIYTAGKNFTLLPAVTAWTNSTSVLSCLFVLLRNFHVQLYFLGVIGVQTHYTVLCAFFFVLPRACSSNCPPVFAKSLDHYIQALVCMSVCVSCFLQCLPIVSHSTLTRLLCPDIMPIAQPCCITPPNSSRLRKPIPLS